MEEKFVHMTDGAHHIIVPADKVSFFEDEKGFSVENDVELAPGALCGHIRVRQKTAMPWGHQRNEVEVTDGHQVVRVDKANPEDWETYQRKGFLELPSLPAKPSLAGINELDQINALMAQWAADAAPLQAARDQITQEARDLDDGRIPQ